MMGGFGGIGMILFWGLIIFAIVLTVRYLAFGLGGGSSPSPGRDPLQTLKERYARGEITTEEYEERKRALESGD